MNFFNYPYFQISLIILLIVIIIWLLTDNFSDSFSDSFSRTPPHIDQLSHQQLIPQNPPVSTQTPDVNNSTLSPPNYERTNQDNTAQNTKMIPSNIYRMNTGREAYQQEQFVSIYDSNFGGMLGTTMGL